jgi:hypothetical protein
MFGGSFAGGSLRLLRRKMRPRIRTNQGDVAYTCVSLWQNGLSEGIMSLGEWISDD